MPSNRVDFKHVREHASFEAVAAHYDIALFGKGDQKTALCCFHQEDSPSLKINVAKKLFNCFGCNKHRPDFIYSSLERCYGSHKLYSYCPGNRDIHPDTGYFYFSFGSRTYSKYRLYLYGYSY